MTECMCWKCNTVYPFSAATCPGCGATNPNVDLDFSLAEMDCGNIPADPDEERRPGKTVMEKNRGQQEKRTVTIAYCGTQVKLIVSRRIDGATYHVHGADGLTRPLLPVIEFICQDSIAAAYKEGTR